MFGRRNPEPPTPTPQASDEDFDLNLLPDDLPPVPAGVPTLSDLLRPDRANDAATADQDGAERPSTTPLALPTNLPEPTPFVPPAPASSAAPVRHRTASESVIGPDDFFDGSYRSERGVRIQGSVKGSIESRQYIFVEASAQVEANLSAEDITISGRFNGVIECRHRLEVTSSGQVQGKVRTALLVVQEGGILHGELHMQAPEEPPAST